MALCEARASLQPHAHASAGLPFVARSHLHLPAGGALPPQARRRETRERLENAPGSGTATGLALALVVLGGSLLRFVGLGKESIWLDEATSLIIARMNLPALVAWAAGDIHPPLYYFALHVWLGLGESEFAVRALSAMLGVLTVAAVYALANELFGPRVGLLSALLLALSPLHIWYSQETRMYVMATALSLLATYLMVLALRRQQPRYWLGYIVASVLALYTHYFTLFTLLFQNVFALYWLWRNSSEWLRKWVLAQAVIALLFSPWLPILYHQVTTGGGGWVEKSVGQPSLYALVDTWLYFNIGLDSRQYPVLLRRMAYGMFAACVLLAILNVSRFSGNTTRTQYMRDQEGVLLCLTYVSFPVLTVWLLSQVKPMYSVRYLLVFLPPYCILLARGIASLRCNGASIVVALFLIATLLVGNWNAWRTEQNADWRGVSRYILEQAQPRDVVLFSPRWGQKPFDYYSRGRVETNMDLPIPVSADAAQRVAEDLSQQYDRVWLVWREGHYSDPDGIVKRILDTQYRTLEERGFRGVDRLLLYDLRTEDGNQCRCRVL